MTDLATRAIAIGGSAGAWRPLHTILANLAFDLDAAILIAVHRYPLAATGYGNALEGATAWRVREPLDVEPLRRGHVYIAAPDHHLRVEARQVVTTRGPREHHARPAIDVLFRSVAREFGSAAVGILLSGTGSDGSAGLLAIRARGGKVVVQTPDDAEEPDMPKRAIRLLTPDYVVRAADIAPLLPGLVVALGDRSMEHETHDPTQAHIDRDIDALRRGGRDGGLTMFTCPDCGGSLWQREKGSLLEYACHIGHRWSHDTLLVHKTEQLEAALLEAVRLLKEKAVLLRQVAAKPSDTRFGADPERLLEQASVDEEHARLLQSELIERDPTPLSETAARAAPVDEG
jgi:two-component system chemotaxis response regulator CheB